MRYALVGYGRMGHEVESIASRRGHERVAVVGPGARGPRATGKIDGATLRGAEVAFEFSEPSAAEDNVVALLAAGAAVVCGTTGWDSSSARVAGAVRRSRGALLVAPNFSIGMNLFFRVVSETARALASSGQYDPFVVESHHRAKADAPGGTARRLGELILAADPGLRRLQEGNPPGPLAPGTVHVASVRAGHEPGTHTVGFDGEHDVITLTHRARARSGLALGAVLAGEWLLGRRGRHAFDEVVEDLLARRPAGAAAPKKGRVKGGRR